jgi:hypothetical protein
MSLDLDEVARDVVPALIAEVAALRAILEGRTIAPTDHELEVHAARGGRWRTRYQVGDPSLCRDGMEAPEAREVRDRMRPLHVYTWWATEADGTPCAWPVVECGLAEEEIAKVFAPIVRATKRCDLCGGTATASDGTPCAGCDGAGEVPT